MDFQGNVILAISDLGFNVPGLLSQLIGFAVLLAAMRVIAYKPVLRMMDQRSERIREGLEAAERMKDEAAQADVAVQKRLDEARQEGQTQIAQAQQIANRIQEEARQQAQTEAESMLVRARNEIALERDEAIAQIRREFADITIAAAEKVIGESLDKKSHERLIEEVLSKASFQGQNAQQ